MSISLFPPVFEPPDELRSLPLLRRLPFADDFRDRLVLLLPLLVLLARCPFPFRLPGISASFVIC
jgi:hypothetical protein